MTDAIRHRGPDDAGYAFIQRASNRRIDAAEEDSVAEVKARLAHVEVVEENAFDVAISHRRFSIVDLSSAGHQPLWTADGQVMIAFNGEIYNHVEVRSQLAILGHRFVSRSDTEVFAEAYRRWGTDCFGYLNGFWAALIYDAKDRRVVAATDRIGKKPLYWKVVDGRVYLASEIKALLEVPEIAASRKVDETAAVRWLSAGLRDIDARTMFAGISRLPAASWALVDESFPSNIVRYWSLPTERMSHRDISIPEAVNAVRETLVSATALRLRADVPVSIELSGGIDSTTVAAVAAETTTGLVRTFTVRFDDHGASEYEFAGTVARHLRTEHVEIEELETGFWQDIRRFTLQMEEPYHSPSMHTHQALWKALGKSGSKVGLNGSGADELFAGYKHYFTPAISQLLGEGQFRRAFRNLANWSEETSSLTVCRRAIASVRNLVSESFPPGVPRMLGRRDWVRLPALPHPVQSRMLGKVLLSDIGSNKLPYWLLADDKAAMSLPFETRSPFLDYRMVELACRLPTAYLVRDGWHKWIVRKAIEPLIPTEVVWRRKKMGFPYPLARFMSEGRDIIDMILRESRCDCIDTSRLGVDEAPDVLWRAISFLLWNEMFVGQRTAVFDAIEVMG